MSRISRKESARTTRVPVASNRAPLVYHGLDRDNFFHRWVIDSDTRVAMFLEAGYEFVEKTSQGGKVGESTVDQSSGLDSRVSKLDKSGKTLFLMRLPIEFQKQDYKRKLKEVDASEEAIKHPGKGKIVNSDVDYGGVSLTRGELNNEKIKAEVVQKELESI